MEDSKPSTTNLTEFLNSGIYRLEDSNAVFIDSVRVLNLSYSRFRVSPSAYYCRGFESSTCPPEPTVSRKRKRKAKKKKPQALNEREQVADERHQVWQAPLYEISLHYEAGKHRGSHCGQCVLPVFKNLVVNETGDDVEADVLNSRYIMPPRSSFYMSDMGQIHNLIPVESDSGFNLIVVDPPWENGSARQKSRYETLPNRYFLSLPIKKLCHTDGALVALWVTNREKLRGFVEKELFPAWGVKCVATFFWLKVKADGSLICDLDLFHHRPYECLLVGICHGKAINSENLLGVETIPDNQIILSVPGDYSRKPQIGGLLLDYAPRLKGGRHIELFAREMTAGWVSWGNEPLHFQESRNFVTKLC